jgi:hypothetical protein
MVLRTWSKWPEFGLSDDWFCPSLSVSTAAPVGHVECERLVGTDAIGCSVAMRMGGQMECNFPLSKEPHFSRITSGLAHEGGGALDDVYNCRSRVMASVMP